MLHGRLSSSSSSSWPGLSALLITVLLRVPLASAYSSLQARQGGHQQGTDFLPECARECVDGTIPWQPRFQKCGGRLECLCGEDPEPYRELLWSCIDNPNNCPPEAHKSTEAAVMRVCDEVLPVSLSSSNATASPTSIVPGSTSPVRTGVSHSATARPASEESKNGSGLSPAAIAGISVGAVAFLGLIIVACFLSTIMRNRRKHREQAHSMVLEPASPRAPGGGWKVHGVDHSGWPSIDSVDSNSDASHYYNSKSLLTPIVTDIPPEKKGAPAINISPVSPVSPSGNSPDAAVAAPPAQTRVVASRKIIENYHLQMDMPPRFGLTPATPVAHGSAEELVSPVSPISDFNRAQLARASSGSVSSASSYHEVLPGQAFTTDSPPSLEGSNRHTCSAATMPRVQRERTPEPSTPPPQYAPATLASSGNTDSGRYLRKPPAAAAAGGGMARTDSIAWRRELEEAAERAMTRVVRSEQSIQEESAGERRRGSSIPGMDLFARRASRDNRGDEESGGPVNNGETGSSFWNRPPRSPGFFSPGRRRDSGATGGGV